MRFGIPTKRLQIDKAQSMTLIVVCVCTAVTIFSLISTKSLLSQAGYHRREINAKKVALKQINDNAASANNLVSQYQIFNSTNPNVLGGKNSSDPNAQPPDGTNARIVLDALPGKYDFPALVSSVSSILSMSGTASPNISGTDQSSTVNGTPATVPEPVPTPITVSGSLSYAGLQNLVKDFERSVRPFDITNLQMHGAASNVAFSLDITSYFQPSKTLVVTDKEVK